MYCAAPDTNGGQGYGYPAAATNGHVPGALRLYGESETTMASSSIPNLTTTTSGYHSQSSSTANMPSYAHATPYPTSSGYGWPPTGSQSAQSHDRTAVPSSTAAAVPAASVGEPVARPPSLSVTPIALDPLLAFRRRKHTSPLDQRERTTLGGGSTVTAAAGVSSSSSSSAAPSSSGGGGGVAVGGSVGSPRAQQMQAGVINMPQPAWLGHQQQQQSAAASRYTNPPAPPPHPSSALPMAASSAASSSSFYSTNSVSSASSSTAPVAGNHAGNHAGNIGGRDNAPAMMMGGQPPQRYTGNAAPYPNPYPYPAMPYPQQQLQQYQQQYPQYQQQYPQLQQLYQQQYQHHSFQQSHPHGYPSSSSAAGGGGMAAGAAQPAAAPQNAPAMMHGHGAAASGPFPHPSGVMGGSPHLFASNNYNYNYMGYGPAASSSSSSFSALPPPQQQQQNLQPPGTNHPQAAQAAAMRRIAAAAAVFSQQSANNNNANSFNMGVKGSRLRLSPSTPSAANSRARESPQGGNSAARSPISVSSTESGPEVELVVVAGPRRQKAGAGGGPPPAYRASSDSSAGSSTVVTPKLQPMAYPEEAEAEEEVGAESLQNSEPRRRDMLRLLVDESESGEESEVDTRWMTPRSVQTSSTKRLSPGNSRRKRPGPLRGTPAEERRDQGFLVTEPRMHTFLAALGVRTLPNPEIRKLRQERQDTRGLWDLNDIFLEGDADVGVRPSLADREREGPTPAIFASSRGVRQRARPFANRLMLSDSPLFLRRNMVAARDWRDLAHHRTTYSAFANAVRFYRTLYVANEDCGLKKVVNGDAVARINDLCSRSHLRPGQACAAVLERLRAVTMINQEDTFVDIGSGDGFAVLAVAALTGCAAYGMEVVESRYQSSVDVMDALLSLVRGNRPLAHLCGETYVEPEPEDDEDDDDEGVELAASSASSSSSSAAAAAPATAAARRGAAEKPTVATAAAAGKSTPKTSPSSSSAAAAASSSSSASLLTPRSPSKPPAGMPFSRVPVPPAVAELLANRKKRLASGAAKHQRRTRWVRAPLRDSVPTSQAGEGVVVPAAARNISSLSSAASSAATSAYSARINSASSSSSAFSDNPSVSCVGCAANILAGRNDADHERSCPSRVQGAWTRRVVTARVQPVSETSRGNPLPRLMAPGQQKIIEWNFYFAATLASSQSFLQRSLAPVHRRMLCDMPDWDRKRGNVFVPRPPLPVSSASSSSRRSAQGPRAFQQLIPPPISRPLSPVTPLSSRVEFRVADARLDLLRPDHPIRKARVVFCNNFDNAWVGEGSGRAVLQHHIFRILSRVMAAGSILVSPTPFVDAPQRVRARVRHAISQLQEVMESEEDTDEEDENDDEDEAAGEDNENAGDEDEENEEDEDADEEEDEDEDEDENGDRDGWATFEEAGKTLKFLEEALPELTDLPYIVDVDNSGRLSSTGQRKDSYSTMTLHYDICGGWPEGVDDGLEEARAWLAAREEKLKKKQSAAAQQQQPQQKKNGKEGSPLSTSSSPTATSPTSLAGRGAGGGGAAGGGGSSFSGSHIPPLLRSRRFDPVCELVWARGRLLPQYEAVAHLVNSKAKMMDALVPVGQQGDGAGGQNQGGQGAQGASSSSWLSSSSSFASAASSAAAAAAAGQFIGVKRSHHNSSSSAAAGAWVGSKALKVNGKHKHKHKSRSSKNKHKESGRGDFGSGIVSKRKRKRRVVDYSGRDFGR